MSAPDVGTAPTGRAIRPETPAAGDRRPLHGGIERLCRAELGEHPVDHALATLRRGVAALLPGRPGR